LLFVFPSAHPPLTTNLSPRPPPHTQRSESGGNAHAADSPTTSSAGKPSSSGGDDSTGPAAGTDWRGQKRGGNGNGNGGGGSGVAQNPKPVPGARPAKIPKLPMVQFQGRWYRAKVLRDQPSRVMVEYQGVNHEGGPVWLAKDSSRLWRGSYKGKDWRYLVGLGRGGRGEGGRVQPADVWVRLRAGNTVPCSPTVT